MQLDQALQGARAKEMQLTQELQAVWLGMTRDNMFELIVRRMHSTACENQRGCRDDGLRRRAKHLVPSTWIAMWHWMTLQAASDEVKRLQSEQKVLEVSRIWTTIWSCWAYQCIGACLHHIWLFNFSSSLSLALLPQLLAVRRFCCVSCQNGRHLWRPGWYLRRVAAWTEPVDDAGKGASKGERCCEGGQWNTCSAFCVQSFSYPVLYIHSWRQVVLSRA